MVILLSYTKFLLKGKSDELIYPRQCDQTLKSFYTFGQISIAVKG